MGPNDTLVVKTRVGVKITSYFCYCWTVIALQEADVVVSLTAVSEERTKVVDLIVLDTDERAILYEKSPSTYDWTGLFKPFQSHVSQLNGLFYSYVNQSWKYRDKMYLKISLVPMNLNILVNVSSDKNLLQT